MHQYTFFERKDKLAGLPLHYESSVFILDGFRYFGHLKALTDSLFSRLECDIRYHLRKKTNK